MTHPHQSKIILEAKDRFELCYRLIDRSDKLRATYGSRAAMVLSSNALVLTTIGVLSGKVQKGFIGNPIILLLICLSVVAVCVSVIFALLSSTGLKGSSNEEANFPDGKRFPFNPADTFMLTNFDVQGYEFKDRRKVFEAYEKFRGLLQDLNYRELVKSASAELWVAYILQRKRYSYLKYSMQSFLAALILLALTLLIILPMTWLAT